MLDINWDGVCWSKLTRNCTSLSWLQISCTLTLDLVRSIKLILQGESTIKRYTYNTQQLLLKFMALQHGHELELMVDRHINRCITREIGFKLQDSNFKISTCKFQSFSFHVLILKVFHFQCPFPPLLNFRYVYNSILKKKPICFLVLL